MDAAALRDPLRGLRPRAPDAIRFYLVRHGEAVLNLTRARALPAAELDRLTPRGQQQASSAGRALSGRPVALIVTSPNTRARDTASAVAGILGTKIPVRVDDRLATILVGRRADGRHVAWAQLIREWRAHRDVARPGGETLAQLGARADAALQDLARDAWAGGAREIALVTHSEVVAAVLGRARRRVPFLETMVGVRNASITVVDLDRAGRYRIVAVNRVPSP